jgi:hypothetical protein
MKFFNPFSRRRPTEALHAPTVTFIGEQDGAAERMLKGELSELFGGRESVQKAYLARVHYGDPKAASVALCLGVTGGADEQIVEKVHSLFAKQFNEAAHLDIIFLSGKQEEQLALVCKPFYRPT